MATETLTLTLDNSPSTNISVEINDTSESPAGAELFTSDGTLTVPAGVTAMSFCAVGAGGGSSGTPYTSGAGGGSGGGGGSLCWANVTDLVPGTDIRIFVGGGGSGGTAGSLVAGNGNNGGQSQVFIRERILMTAGGGEGGDHFTQSGADNWADGGQYSIFSNVPLWFPDIPDNNEDLIGGVNYNDGFRSVRFLFGTILRLNFYTNPPNSGNYTTPAEHWQYVLDEVWLDGWGEGDTITCPVSGGTDVIFTITDGTVTRSTGTYSTWEYTIPVEVTQGDVADITASGGFLEGQFNHTFKTFTIGTSGGGNGGRGGQDGGYYGQGGGGGGAGGYTNPGGNAGGDSGSNGIGGGGGGGANSSGSSSSQALGYGGGGVGITGSGTSGYGGNTAYRTDRRGAGGSSGGNGGRGTGGAYGGGAGARATGYGGTGSGGGNGAVRVIWGSGKSYPDNAT